MKLTVHWTKWSPWEYGRTKRERKRELVTGKWQGKAIAVQHEMETWGDDFIAPGIYHGLDLGRRTHGYKLYTSVSRALAPLRKVLKP